MPKSSAIKPRRVFKNGTEQWLVRCPKDLIQSDRPRRKFFPSKAEAQNYCGELMESRGTLKSLWHRLTDRDREIILRLMARCANDARELERLVDLGAKQSAPVIARALKSALEEFVAAKKSEGVSEHMLRNYAAFKAGFLKAFPGATIAELSGPKVDDWLRMFKNPVTRNHKRTQALTFLRWMQAREYVAESVKWRLSVAIEPARDVEIYGPKEFEDMLKFAQSPPEKWKELRDCAVPYLVLGAFAGLRTTEIIRLDWADVKMDRNIIHVRATRTKRTKNVSGRVVPMQSNLIAWLKPFAQKSGPVVTHKNISDAVVKAFAHWKKNALRHSFTSYRVAVTQNEAQVATEIGDLVTTMKRHYKQAVDPKTGADWFAILP